MKLLIGTVAMVSGVVFAVAMASANPALLPKHEGYPMKNSGSPVNGQPTANDPGQTDARGESTLTKAAAFDDKHVSQNLKKAENDRVTASEGAGRLPKVQGPQIQIAPPVTSATPEKMMSRGVPPAASTRSSSPPETMSNPQPACANTCRIASEGLAFMA